MAQTRAVHTQELLWLAIAVVVLGLAAVVTVLRRRTNVNRRDTFVERCAALGLTPVTNAEQLTCGGEVGGARVLALYVEQRLNGVPMGPRIDLLLDAGLLGPRQGAALLQPDRPSLAAKDPTFAPLLTFELTTLVTAELGGRFGVSALNSLVPTATLHQLARAKWGTTWSGLMVRTWVDLDADPPTIQRALEALLRARDVLARAPGVSARASA